MIRKKIYASICSLAVLFTSFYSIQVLANDNVNISNLDFADTITEEQKNSLNPALIRALSEEEGEVVSISSVKVPIDYTRDMKYDFNMYVVAQRINEKPGKDNFRFIASGRWVNNPIWELTDCIALAWSDDFTLYDDECYTLNYYDDPKKLTWCTSINSVQPEQGIAYNVDLLNGEEQEYIMLEAKVYKNNTSGSANVVGAYGHLLVTAQDITVGFTGGKDASISMSAIIGLNLSLAKPDYDSFDY